MASPDDYRHSVVDNEYHHPDRQRGCLFGDYQFKGLGVRLRGRLLVSSMSGHSFRDYSVFPNLPFRSGNRTVFRVPDGVTSEVEDFGFSAGLISASASEGDTSKAMVLVPEKTACLRANSVSQRAEFPTVFIERCMAMTKRQAVFSFFAQH
jgi:hypothetical protein